MRFKGVPRVFAEDDMPTGGVGKGVVCFVVEGFCFAQSGRVVDMNLWMDVGQELTDGWTKERLNE